MCTNIYLRFRRSMIRYLLSIVLCYISSSSTFGRTKEFIFRCIRTIPTILNKTLYWIMIWLVKCLIKHIILKTSSKIKRVIHINMMRMIILMKLLFVLLILILFIKHWYINTKILSSYWSFNYLLLFLLWHITCIVKT